MTRKLTQQQVKNIRMDEAKRQRYGSSAPVRLAPIYTGDKRKHRLGLLMDTLRDWRLSSLEREGPARHGMRSALCLEGHGWGQSDLEAATMVREALNLLGVKRPTWEEGQKEYTIPAEDCRWCAMPIEDDSRRLRRNTRFCSTECATSAMLYRETKDKKNDDLAYQAAYTMVLRAKHPPRLCEHCGDTFTAVSSSPQRFCSFKCERTRRRRPQRECPGCKTMFWPSEGRPGADRKFCSRECLASHGRLATLDKVCIWCEEQFTTRSNSGAYYCSDACANVSRRFRCNDGRGARTLQNPDVFDALFTRRVNNTRIWPRAMTGPMFDKFFAAA